jgi:hypothetical protein
MEEPVILVVEDETFVRNLIRYIKPPVMPC